MKNKRLKLIILAAVILLFIPLIAMQYTNEVNWSRTDFLTLGFLLLTTGFLCEFIMRKVKRLRKRFLVCGAVLFLFFLVWAELAVGLFGTPFAGS